MIDCTPRLYSVIKSFEMTLIQNIDQKNEKLKVKDIETRKAKIQKEENLVLLKRTARKCRLISNQTE